MSTSPTRTDADRLQEGIESGIDRVKSAAVGDESGDPLTGTAKELFDVLRASDALRERNPDLAFDLGHLERVVDSRELWNSVDLLEFAKAKRTLDPELDDVLGEDAPTGIGGDSKVASDVGEFVSSLHSEAKGVLLQQEGRTKTAAPRRAIVAEHAALERLDESNRARFAEADERRADRTSTAVSLFPSGPLPDGVSTRLSTVPSKVPHSVMDALPRIYGRRWRSARSRDE